jgi:hypothetical protein
LRKIGNITTKMYVRKNNVLIQKYTNKLENENGDFSPKTANSLKSDRTKLKLRKQLMLIQGLTLP